MLQVVSKIRSQRGASLSIALFLFLVCAMVASVVLVAGTAASGRLADLGKADKHYYSVASAIELMKDQLEKEKASNSYVTVEEKLSYTEVRDGDAYTYQVAEGSNTVTVLPSSEESSLQKALGKYLVYGTVNATGSVPSGTWDTSSSGPISEEEWYSELIKWEDKPVMANNTSPLKFKLGCAGDSDLPEVTLSIEFASDGSAKVTFQSSPKEGDNDIYYTAYATLVPDFAISTNVTVEPNGRIHETKTIDLCWELFDITGERAM